MSQFILQTPYNWMSPDRDYWSANECTYMQNISVDNMRFEQLDSTYASIWDTTYTFTVNQMVESGGWVISLWSAKVFLNTVDKTATVAGASRIEITGDWVNYFIDNTNILQTNSAITSVTNTKAHAGWTVTASVLIYKSILFSIGSTIYSYDLTALGTAPASLETNIPIITGSTVKYMYFYNDMLVIVTTKDYDTIIYQVQYTSTGYEIYSTEIKKGFTCYWAIWDSGTVYWTTTDRIFGFQGGNSQELRYVWFQSDLTDWFFGSSPRLAFDKGILYIANGTTIYKYGRKFAGRKNSLTVRTFWESIQAITWNFIHTQSGTNKIYKQNTAIYPNSGYSISLPYDTWVYWDEKTNLQFRVGYQLQTGTTITIGVMTDEMELSSPSTYVTVATIIDTTKQRQYVSVSEINTALETASKNSDWQSIRFKKTLNGAGGSTWARTLTPKLFDIKCIHNEINDEIS